MTYDTLASYDLGYFRTISQTHVLQVVVARQAPVQDLRQPPPAPLPESHYPDPRIRGHPHLRPPSHLPWFPRRIASPLA